ncbi:MAG TPA: NAD-dependent epimerase/dehydratase family protein, partial [Pyrinomonadaceae bacterium]|nr:NAD-dependent epimerase/dehydratase family protein [Pyrinomonadaceae bacterium]
MSTSRRKFLKLSALAGGSVGAGLIPGFSALSNSARALGSVAAKPLNILILGGTGFTGPFQVKYALGRGHKVTVFNRGKTHPGELPKEAEQLLGDRNGQLDALKGRKWDVCIDIPTTLPVWVRDAAQILKGNVDRYIFISTISVFSDNSKPNMDESGPLAEYKGADAMAETQTTLRANMNLYGQLKALSEKEAEKWFPGKALVIRPGLIVGPGDESDRFTYWPVRVEKGGEVLAPGTPNDPVQIIDARDLAEWVIRMAEQGTVGTFNATGPNYKLTMGKMLNDIKAATKSNATFTFADADFLKAQKVRAWGDMPTWVPPRGETLGFSQVNVQKAISKGLTFRSVGDTT